MREEGDANWLSEAAPTQRTEIQSVFDLSGGQPLRDCGMIVS